MAIKPLFGEGILYWPVSLFPQPMMEPSANPSTPSAVLGTGALRTRVEKMAKRGKRKIAMLDTRCWILDTRGALGVLHIAYFIVLSSENIIYFV
jgi:hypothetical protein